MDTKSLIRETQIPLPFIKGDKKFNYLVHSPSCKKVACLLAFIVHLLPKVCSIGGQGAWIHCTWTLAQTGAYSIVHAVHSPGHGVNSQLGHVLPTELPSGHTLASIVHAVGHSLPDIDHDIVFPVSAPQRPLK